nr:claudin-34-like [Pelodiscus sinensis]XP_025038918.1 claudin-34-like [Pelodiscus sinensis]|eukprot:XP_025038917.1 claudin-34-like [Pelodiscus sinensis]
MADSTPDRTVTQVENLKVVNFLAITSHIPLLAFVLSVLGWILCMISLGLIPWRVWHLDNSTLISSGNIWIRMWDVCFTFNPELTNGSSLMLCQGFNNQDTFIPSEMVIAQDLLILAAVMEAVAICLVLFLLWSNYKKELKEHYILIFFLTGGVLNIMSSVFILIPVSWNLQSIMKNHSIAFPPSYHLPSTPTSQEVGSAIHVGLAAVLLLLLSGILLLCDRYLNLDSKVHPKTKEPDQVAHHHKQTCLCKYPSARSSQTYPHCGSCLEIDLWGPKRPFGIYSCSGINPHGGPVLKKSQVLTQGPTTSFQIPSGPFPHRPSTCLMSDSKIFIAGEKLLYF